MFNVVAYAAETTAASGGSPMGGGFAGMSSILMIVAMFAIMYFLLIRPQRKKDKQTKEMIAALGVGDVITTIGGIVGKITKIKDDEIMIVTGLVGNPNERSTMRFAKWAIRDVVKKAEGKNTFDEPEELEAATDEVAPEGKE